MKASKQGVELRVKGKVQGVGFRPFVWLLANKHGLIGDVNNDGQGVLVRFCEPPAEKLALFLTELYSELPPLAEITELYQQDIIWQQEEYSEFIIRESENNQMDTQIIPDAATCSHCLADLFDEQNRRFHYPFTNCTHCGPRFTIIKAIPYDRKNTSMVNFPFCTLCEAEYKNPADRRFHAQPNACDDCGPHIWLRDSQNILAERENALKQTALLLQQGKIVAIKGIGGFHLACDATNPQAIERLRQRKKRPSKPLAIMVENLQQLQDLTAEETKVLTSVAAPIVLLAKHKVSPLLMQNLMQVTDGQNEQSKQISAAELIAPKLAEIGVMLPSNPLQHLLLREVRCPLVMTSGNASGLPPALDNEDALQDLANLADAFLLHNRDILQRADDSLVRVAFDGMETLRRARGYVPNEILLQDSGFHHVLAMGSDLKNTFCLLRQNKAVVSQHIGDTAKERIQSQLKGNLTLFQQIYQFKPNLIAVDAHQGYFSTQTGKELAETLSIPYVEILHHHAHILSVMAEHRCQEQVIGIALDGIGMGEKGQLWGGECLLVDRKNCQHLGGLPPVALAGGDLAAMQPWRNWLAHLQQFVPNWQEIAEESCYGLDWQVVARAIERGINSPMISSAGRLFDAVAYGLGIAPQTLSWEGEAACQLEVLAMKSSLAADIFTQDWRDKAVLSNISHNVKQSMQQNMRQNVAKSAVDFSVTMPLNGTTLDLQTFWHNWLNYQGNAADKAFIFHYALAEGFATLARQQAKHYHCKTIVLSGGVMHNQLLRYLLKMQLSDFCVLSGQQFPMNDGGLSLGQAVIAMR